ncbi:MAG: ATP-binding protein [Crocosphaera sp.]
MFNFKSKEKPLPTAVLNVNNGENKNKSQKSGILLGNNCYWNPASLPNGHIAAIGASGSGKTQTLKAIAYSLRQTYPNTQLFIIDFHGDQQIEGETVYPLHMASPHGINPLTVNLDPEGGGPNLQAIAVTSSLKKTLRLGPNQEGKILEAIKACYIKRGIYQEKPQTWTLQPPNFNDLEEELNRRSATSVKDDNKKELAENINLNDLKVGKPNTSGIYFIFHKDKLVYIGAARDIQKRFDGHHHIRYLLKDHYSGEQDQIELRYFEQPNDWQQLITLENYLIQLHTPPLNQTILKTECKESAKLKLKLAATFQYGIFSREQPSFTEKHIRIDLSKLPPELAAIASESLASQLMNQHRLMGETDKKLPKTYLFIDEAKELKNSPACDRIIADGRKYGLGLVLASQSERHLSSDIIGNSSTKIVLPVDQTEVKKVARKFRLAEKKVAALTQLTALCRFGTQAEYVEILPYYQRIDG